MYISLSLPVIKIAACHAISLADDVDDDDDGAAAAAAAVAASASASAANKDEVGPKLLRLEPVCPLARFNPTANGLKFAASTESEIEMKPEPQAEPFLHKPLADLRLYAYIWRYIYIFIPTLYILFQLKKQSWHTHTHTHIVASELCFIQRK